MGNALVPRVAVAGTDVPMGARPMPPGLTKPPRPVVRLPNDGKTLAPSVTLAETGKLPGKGVIPTGRGITETDEVGMAPRPGVTLFETPEMVGVPEGDKTTPGEGKPPREEVTLTRFGVKPPEKGITPPVILDTDSGCIDATLAGAGTPLGV